MLLQNGPTKNLTAAGKQFFLRSIYITHANTSITLSFQRGAGNVLIHVRRWGLSVGLHQVPILHPRWVRGQHSWLPLAATAFRSSIWLVNPSHNSRGHPQAVAGNIAPWASFDCCRCYINKDWLILAQTGFDWCMYGCLPNCLLSQDWHLSLDLSESFSVYFNTTERKVQGKNGKAWPAFLQLCLLSEHFYTSLILEARTNAFKDSWGTIFKP